MSKALVRHSPGPPVLPNGSERRPPFDPPVRAVGSKSQLPLEEEEEEEGEEEEAEER